MQVVGGMDAAHQVAKEHGFVNLGTVSKLSRLTTSTLQSVHPNMKNTASTVVPDCPSTSRKPLDWHT